MAGFGRQRETLMMIICRGRPVDVVTRAARALKWIAVAWACASCLPLAVNAQAEEVTLGRATEFVREELKFEMSVRAAVFHACSQREVLGRTRPDLRMGQMDTGLRQAG